MLDEPIQLEGVLLTEEEARAVTQKLETKVMDQQTMNIIRLGYGRYGINLDGLKRYAPVSGTTSISFKSHLVNITLYTDPDYTEPFWSGLSTSRARMEREEHALQEIPFHGIEEPGAR